jgi:AraC family transcriptional regulator
MSDQLGSIHDVAERFAQRSNAIANLGVLGAGRAVPEHSHTNPYLWLHVLGSYGEAGDCGEREIRGPAAMFFPAGSTHGMAIRERGLVSVIIEFDEAWLGRRLGSTADLRRPRQWIGGEAGRRASRLARLWLSGQGGDGDRFALTETFLRWAMEDSAERRAPPWLDHVDTLIANGSTRTCDLASRFGVSAAWLARAYRACRGEGLPEAMRRRRVEAAAILLETDPAGLADIALAAGFCDQSHMTRAFGRHLGRTPGAIRGARLGLAG